MLPVAWIVKVVGSVKWTLALVAQRRLDWHFWTLNLHPHTRFTAFKFSWSSLFTLLLLRRIIPFAALNQSPINHIEASGYMGPRSLAHSSHPHDYRPTRRLPSNIITSFLHDTGCQLWIISLPYCEHQSTQNTSEVSQHSLTTRNRLWHSTTESP